MRESVLVSVPIVDGIVLLETINQRLAEGFSINRIYEVQGQTVFELYRYNPTDVGNAVRLAPEGGVSFNGGF